MTVPDQPPFSAALVPFPVERNLPGLPAPADVRRLLSEQFDAAVTRERERRGTVTRPSDTWPMVRAVEGFASLVDDYARCLSAVSKSARGVLEEELVEANGEQDGIPNGPLNVPADDGGVISVKAKTANEYDIDSGQVIGALVASVTAEWQASGRCNGDPSCAPEEFAIDVAERVLVMVGAADLKVSHVRALAIELGQQGQDALSQVVSDAIRKRVLFKGVTVDHKQTPAPRGRRAS